MACPSFEHSGSYNGVELSAQRWITRLEYDFKRAGVLKPTPKALIHAINMLAEGEVATFIDSRYRAICEKQHPSEADRLTLYTALKREYPPRLIDIKEETIHDQIRDLMQDKDEGIQAYAQRTAQFLYKCGGKDRSLSWPDLAPIESFVLTQIIEAFVIGLFDDELRCDVIKRFGDCTSLWKTKEVIIEIKKSRDAVSRIEKLLSSMQTPSALKPEYYFYK